MNAIAKTETGSAIAVPATLDVGQVERVRAMLAASKSPATRRAYRTAWAAWCAWADSHGASVLPAHPDAVAAYLADRQGSGSGMATLRLAAAAIGAAHRMSGHDNPCTSDVVRSALSGAGRQAADAGVATRQARGLTAEAVATIRGSINGRVESDVSAALTMAIVSVMSDAGLRRSEAAALTWADVTEECDGSGRVLVRKSKTDQEGSGAVVAITAAAMSDLRRLRAMRPDRGSDADAVFGLGPQRIGQRIGAAAKAAGLGDGYGGHSGRVGMAQRMVRNGAPVAATCRQGRWKSAEMVNRYTRNEQASEALRWL